MQLLFDGIRRPVDFLDCESLAEPLAEILSGWRFRPSSGLRERPAITLRREADGYRLQSDWLEGSLFDSAPVSTVCSFIVDLVKAYIADAQLLCLHCGAVEFAGRLVVFPSWYRAGKSTLCVRLAAAGWRLYADDVLAIAPSDAAGMALGIAPRLRRPLPRQVGADFRAFVSDHEGPKDNRYVYLRLPSDRLAPLGTKAPIGGIVLLERKQFGRAELIATSRAEALKRLLGQNFGFPGGAELVFERLASMAQRLPCFTLSYADLDEAAAALENAFARPDALPDEVAGAPATDEPHHAGSGFEGALPARRCRAPRGRCRRVPSVVARSAAGDRFLVDPRTDRIFHLNPVAAGVWDILAEPTVADEAARLLAEAFPEADRDAIRRDVQKLFASLLANGLIERCRC